MHMSANLGHPDQIHFPPPLPPTPPTPDISCKRKLPSQLRRQERRQQERAEEVAVNESLKDITLINPAKNVEEGTIQTEKCDPTLFNCTHCDHGFITNEALLVHMKSIHPTFSPQAIKCTHCDYDFTSSEALLVHMKSIHPSCPSQEHTGISPVLPSSSVSQPL